MPRPTPHSLAWLKSESSDLRDLLLRRGAVPAGDVQGYWPKGSENPYRGIMAWRHCYAHMMRLFGQSTKAEIDDAMLDKARRALADAAAARPIPISCSDGIERAVYPKGLPALAFLDGLKASFVQLAELHALALRAQDVADLQFLTIAPFARAYACQLFVWVLTHEGPGLPFHPIFGDAGDPPAWVADLAPQDYLAISIAHLTVNRARIETMAILNPEGGTSQLPAEGWVAAYAHEKGMRTIEMLERFSLGEMIAQSIASHVAAKEAEARAKQKRDVA